MSILEKYRDEVSIRKPGGRWEHVRINRFLREFKGKITPDKLKIWRDQRLKTIKATTLNRDLNLISAAYNYAINEWGHKEPNPVHLIKRPKNGRGRKRRVSLHEFEQITGAVWGGKQGWLIPKMFEFAIETGMRLGEIASLEKANVFEKYAHLVKTKNGDDRDVPLSVRAREILEEVAKGNRLLPNDIRVFPVNKEAVGAQFRYRLKTMGIKDLHFHDTRHEAASRLSKIFTALELAAILGHRELRSLMTYYNPTAAELAEKMR